MEGFAAGNGDSKAQLLGDGYGPGFHGTVATLILSKVGVKIGSPQVLLPHSPWITRKQELGRTSRFAAVTSYLATNQTERAAVRSTNAILSSPSYRLGP
jgi:hypothetical protein